jgi:hypothetical protein
MTSLICLTCVHVSEAVHDAATEVIISLQHKHGGELTTQAQLPSTALAALRTQPSTRSTLPTSSESQTCLATLMVMYPIKPAGVQAIAPVVISSLGSPWNHARSNEAMKQEAMKLGDGTRTGH